MSESSSETMSGQQTMTGTGTDEAKMKAAASRHLQASFGQVVGLLMRNGQFRARPLADLEKGVLPALVTGQFMIAERQSEQNGFTGPVAAILWARLSDDLDKQIAAEPQKLQKIEAAHWKSGDNVWLVTAVGDQQVLQGMMKKAKETIFKDRDVKYLTPNPDGGIKVELVNI